MLIGVDIGTQGTKTALFAEDGRCLARAFRPSKLHRPKPGVVEEDADRQVASVCETIRECVRQARVKDVAGIGIDGQMAGVIGVGADGRAVTPYDSWLDTRCAPYIAKMPVEEVIRKAGGPPSFNHGPKKLWWKHERPATYRRIRSFVQPGGYAAMRLCGLDSKQAFIDYTYLHFSGFADNPRRTWNINLCERLKLDSSKLPRIVAPHDVVGTLSAAMAARCGLRAGVPVVAGCGDTAASFLASGATREGICVDVAGTASVFAATTRQFMADTRQQTLSCGQAATPGLWHPYAYINGGGMNLEWFRKEIAGERFSFDELDRLAARISPAEDCPMFVPHLGGRVSPSWPRLGGAWAGLRWSHSVAHLYRAVREAVALEYAIYRNVLRELNPSLRLREVRVTGGGEKSALWNQIKADALGVRVVQIAGAQGAPMGAALVAGFGVGLFKDLDASARAWIKTGRVTLPQRKLAGHYARRLARYERLLEELNQWSS
ncbi:MAG: xylulose kinase [Verrucomicrobia bacterium]|nr:xylulose kinase [Verrucomicrobiota bacterium]MBM3890364.1 xylulose kinase [Verrucomicrobiota bacterium]